jgi:putative ATPase
MPEGLEDVRLYVPKDVGKESSIKKRLEQLWGKMEGEHDETRSEG